MEPEHLLPGPGFPALGSPARHYSCGRHRPETDGVPGPWPLAWRVGRIRPQFLTAAAVALALASAGNVYSTHGQVPPRSNGNAAVSGSSFGGTAGQRLPAVLTRVAKTAAVPPSEVRTDAAAGQGAEAAGAPAAPPAVTVPVQAAPIGPELDARINAVIAANSRHQLGVALIDVSDGVLHGYGVQDKFVAASTGKILAAAAYYNLVERGQASLAAPLGVSTAGGQIRQMVQQSNNTSWTLILGALGQRALADYAASIGIGYDRTLNTLTPGEMARILELLYTGRLLNTEHTQQLLSYMQGTNFETLIPAAVPPGVSVFHKYGLLSGNLHDASVLASGDRAYVFVVYTLGRNLSDMEDRARVIRALTETVAAGLF